MRRSDWRACPYWGAIFVARSQHSSIHCASSVLFAEIVCGAGSHDGGADEAVLLPVQAAFDHPPQDAGPLGAKLLLQRLSTTGGLWVNGARLKRRRAASSTLCRSGTWLPMTVSLNCGLNSKKSLSHEACRNPVAASQLLDPHFGPCAAFLGFGGADHAGALQCGEIGRVPVVL